MLYWSMLRTEREAKQLEAALHLPHGIAQRVGGELGLGNDRGEEMGDALVHPQLDALRIDQDHSYLFRCRFEEHRHDHGVDGDGFAAARRAGDEHVRHGGEIGNHDAPVDVLAHGEGQLELCLGEGAVFDHVAQPDGFAVVIRHLDSDGALAGHALDEDALGGHRKTEVVGQAGDARVFHARFGAELEGGHDRAGIDLRDLAGDVEFGALFDQYLCLFTQFVFANDLLIVGAVQQCAGRQAIAGDGPRRQRDGMRIGVGALADGDAAGVLGAGILIGVLFPAAIERAGPYRGRFRLGITYGGAGNLGPQ